MSHGPHQSSPTYSPNQLLVDGCMECEHRKTHRDRGIGYLDQQRFAHAWLRAGQWLQHGLPDMSHAEAPLLDTLAAIQVKLENYGIPIGVLPGSAEAPVVAGRPCGIDWGSATPSQRCVVHRGHLGAHKDVDGHQWYS